MLSAWLLVLTRGGLVPGHDNFAHWAIMAKTVITQAQLPNTANTAVEFVGYPPATACWIDYVCGTVGLFRRHDDVQPGAAGAGWGLALWGCAPKSARAAGWRRRVPCWFWRAATFRWPTCGWIRCWRRWGPGRWPWCWRCGTPWESGPGGAALPELSGAGKKQRPVFHCLCAGGAVVLAGKGQRSPRGEAQGGPCLHGGAFCGLLAVAAAWRWCTRRALPASTR